MLHQRLLFLSYDFDLSHTERAFRMPEFPLDDQRLFQTGVGGFPRAKPYFASDAEDLIRHEPLCCGPPPGPNVPYHWLEAGSGWVTKFFTDVVPLDRRNKVLGRYRCQVRDMHGQQCPYEVQEEKQCCACGPCWTPDGAAPIVMMQHVAQHGIMHQPAPLSQWTSGLCSTEGCLDTLFCTACNGSRQMMALSGWEDRFHWGWCLIFCFLGLRGHAQNGRGVIYYVPPHWFVAMFTRFRLVELNSIDEGCCTTFMIILCCAPCSVAQTHRELGASGAFPGSYCGSGLPSNYGVLAQASSAPLRVKCATMV